MKFVSRADWGAKAPNCSSPLPAVDAIAFHYTAMDADERSSHSECAARVRGIQAYHQNTQGWCDIAYNFVVCKHGYVFEGRGFRYSGATGNDNSHTIAVCFLGDDTANRDDLTDDGRQALVDVTRHIQKQLGKRLSYKGHRSFMGTACPGNEIYNYITSAAFAAKVNSDTPPDDDMVSLARIKELEAHAKAGTSPGKLTEAENNIFWSQRRCRVSGEQVGGEAAKRLSEIDAVIHRA